MIFKQIESGGDRNYAYLAACEKTKEGVLIDPSPDPYPVIKAVMEEDVEIKYLINTHSHYDHSHGNDKFLQSTRGKPVTFINCGSVSQVKDNRILFFGELSLEIIPTPGHTPDSICIKIENRIITGDTLFVGKVGGTYNEKDARTEFESLKKIMALDPDIEVWPGHNYGVKPNSTIAFELETNPFIKRLVDFKKFLWLKQNWAAYKLEQNIK